MIYELGIREEVEKIFLKLAKNNPKQLIIIPLLSLIRLKKS